MTSFKKNNLELQNQMLKLIFEKYELDEVTRQELDLLKHSVLKMDSKDVAWLHTYCKFTDFADETYQLLRQKLSTLFPEVLFSKKLEYHDYHSYTLRTQKQIEDLINSIMSEPVPKELICVSKPISILWYQYNPDKKSVLVMRKTIDNSFRTKITKAFIKNSDPSSFKYLSNELDKCSIEVKNQEHLNTLLGELVNDKSKALQINIDELKDIFIEVESLKTISDDKSGGGYVSFFFETKYPKID
jgi:hypothetical protein